MWIICVVTALPECGAVAHLGSEVALPVITLYNLYPAAIVPQHEPILAGKVLRPL